MVTLPPSEGGAGETLEYLLSSREKGGGKDYLCSEKRKGRGKRGRRLSNVKCRQGRCFLARKKGGE